jgi:hypothetical protein
LDLKQCDQLVAAVFRGPVDQIRFLAAIQTQPMSRSAVDDLGDLRRQRWRVSLMATKMTTRPEGEPPGRFQVGEGARGGWGEP